MPKPVVRRATCLGGNECMIDYFIRVAPATIVICTFLFLLPKKFTELRIASYIMMFVIFRDAMTPMGFWEINSKHVFRFHGTPLQLVILGIGSTLMAFTINHFEPGLKKLVVYFKGEKSVGLAIGLACALLIATPVVVYSYISKSEHEALSGVMIFAILILAMMGNFLEEILFRGYLQGYLENSVGAKHAAVLSGFFFSVAHASLATIITSFPIAILGFTLYEGLIAAFVRRKYGVVPATIAHGGAIFLIASGIL